MTLEIFLTGLLLVSILTGLVTEAIKRICEEQNKKYYSNTIAGIVAVVLAVLVDMDLYYGDVSMPTLHKGSSGSDVKELELQILLIKAGYSCGKYGTDGKFGDGTLEARCL